MTRFGPAVSALLLAATPLAAPLAAQSSRPATSPPSWNVDESHSRVGFSVRHFFTPVTGSFGDYDVALAFDPERPEEGSVRVTVDAASIDTDNARRDDDLRGATFFDVGRYPELTFESRSIRATGEGEFVVEGDLTIRDVTRRVELQARLLGVRDVEASRRGRRVAGLEASGKIDRRDFGVGSGRWAETVVLDSDVEIDILLEVWLP